MKLSQLQKKYPKAFDKFIKRYTYTHALDNNIREWWSDITDFMDKQGIIITTSTYGRLFYGAIYIKDIDKEVCFEWESKCVTSRSQAETKAICKAFEILEERL